MAAGCKDARYSCRDDLDRAVRGGRPRHARAPRRQGRERRGDDARARALSACRPASRSPRRRAWPTCAPTGSSRTVSPSRPRMRCARWRSAPASGSGDADDPLLVSVRSGARESMPGMMDTVLNLGLTDASVEGLAARTRQPALRVGRVPAVRADVRQRLPRDPRRALRGSDRRAQARRRRRARRRAGRGGPARARRRVQGDLRRRDGRGLPAGSRRAAARGDPRRVRLVAGQARRDVPAHQPHPRRLGHRLQRPADGLRQQGPDVVLGRGVLARRGDRRAGAVGRLPRRRAGRGRRLGRAHAAGPGRDGDGDARGARDADARSCGRSRRTTATCRTRSSRSRRAGSTCCRRATRSARRRPRCASPSTRSPRGCCPSARRW